MKEKILKSDDGGVAEILQQLRTAPKPQRPVGRLPQLNKHAKKMRRVHNPFIETDEPSLS